MARATAVERLQQRAKYQIGSIVQVYTIFDGWQECEITKLDWDHMYGRVQCHVLPVGKPVNHGWITDEKCMKAVK